MLSTYSSHDHAQAFSEFLAYKTRVPVRGAILLNKNMDEVLLVKGWKKGANWSFPRGKINKDEPDLDCAIREVYEETGYDVNAAGLVKIREYVKYIEMNLREQHMRLYVFRGVPMDTHFEPRTRKEISKIKWWKLSDLPTLKKRRVQQEGQGGDPANSANKFYMVAPFLPQLKKWISAQRKLDKTRQTSPSGPTINVSGEEALAAEDYEMEEEMVPQAVNGDMGKLLEGLRQSAQPAKTSDLPEVTVSVGSEENLASQLKSLLGVATTSTAVPKTAERSSVSDPTNNPKAESLLALLQSKPAPPVQLPQTPLNQVIDQPSMPSSPPHPNHQSQRFSSMPLPPTFPSQDEMAAIESRMLHQPQPPQVRHIPPPQQPAQLIPQNTHFQYNKPFTRPNINHHSMAPYQRTGDPQFSQYAHNSGYQQPSIPPASKLPAPKLNAQSSALLSLFKADAPAKASSLLNSEKMDENKVRQENGEISSKDQRSKAEEPQSEANAKSISKKGDAQRTSHSTSIFVPPQVLSRARLGKSSNGSASKAEHQDELLRLFRSPSTHAAQPVKQATPTLQLPSAPIELSALPTTPGHSREPSMVDDHIKEQYVMSAQKQSAERGERPQPIVSLQSPPVSATINGPMNIPQFEMVAKVSKDAKKRNETLQTPKRSPVRILTRPRSSGQPSATAPAEPVSETKQAKVMAPKLQTSVTPIKKPPPTPDLKGHEAPPKAFHPQILRRPAHFDDANEPSPIQPLPSPKHDVRTNRQATRPSDHRQSLLSLFTKPSPAISPAPTGPASAVDPSALISPLAGITPKEQADVAFARLTNSVGKLSHAPVAAPETTQLPMLRTGSINSALATGSKLGQGSKSQTPMSKTTAPMDKAFLLGFLNSVAEGGR